MRSTKYIKRMLERFGHYGEIFWGDYNTQAKMIVQPMRYKNKMYLNNEITDLGTIDESCYLYIGRPEYPLVENTTECTVRFKSMYYMVVKTETVFYLHQPAYIWAILRVLRTGDD